MPRIVFNSSDSSAKELQRVADELEMSKVKTLQLALSVMAKLTQEISRGTELVLRQTGGKEVGLWLPQVRRTDRQGSADGSTEPKKSKRPRRPGRKLTTRTRKPKK